MVELSARRHEQELLINFSELMKKKLFIDSIQAADSKEELCYYVTPIDKDIALHKKFIKYGTKKATNFIIIDIDNERCSLDQYKKRIDYIFKDECYPSWILKSDKGFHVGFF